MYPRLNYLNKFVINEKLFFECIEDFICDEIGENVGEIVEIPYSFLLYRRYNPNLDIYEDTFEAFDDILDPDWIYFTTEIEVMAADFIASFKSIRCKYLQNLHEWLLCAAINEETCCFI